MNPLWKSIRTFFLYFVKEFGHIRPTGFETTCSQDKKLFGHFVSPKTVFNHKARMNAFSW